MPKKITFQIKAAGAIGNDKIDANELYEDAIAVEEKTYLTDGTKEKIIEHGEYIRGVMYSGARREDVKYPGIVWKPETGSPVNGVDYVKSDPDLFVVPALAWVVEVLREWATKEKAKKFEHVQKDKPGRPAAYDSVHIEF